MADGRGARCAASAPGRAGEGVGAAGVDDHGADVLAAGGLQRVDAPVDRGRPDAVAGEDAGGRSCRSSKRITTRSCALVLVEAGARAARLDAGHGPRRSGNGTATARRPGPACQVVRWRLRSSAGLGLARRGSAGGGTAGGGFRPAAGGQARRRPRRGAAGGVGAGWQQHLDLGALAAGVPAGADLVVGQEADDLRPRVLQGDRRLGPPVLDLASGPSRRRSGTGRPAGPSCAAFSAGAVGRRAWRRG